MGQRGGRDHDHDWGNPVDARVSCDSPSEFVIALLQCEHGQADHGRMGDVQGGVPLNF